VVVEVRDDGIGLAPEEAERAFEESDGARARASGFDAHMTKPADLQALLALVEKLSRQAQDTSGTIRPCMSPEPTTIDREVQEALRVRAMSGAERAEWLAATWGRLQRQAAQLYAPWPDQPAEVASFPTLQEKNAADEARQLEFALRRAPLAQSRR
jgi:hypothetical protein